MFGILIFFGILQIARSSLAFHFSDEKLLGHVVRPSPSTMNVETLQERLIGTKLWWRRKDSYCKSYFRLLHAGKSW
jgi:hypothetical protein